MKEMQLPASIARIAAVLDQRDGESYTLSFAGDASDKLKVHMTLILILAAITLAALYLGGHR